MRTGLITVVLSLAAVATFAADDELDDAFDKDVLIIEASKFACHRLDIYLAIDNTQRARGLMHVRELPPTTGMLFVYEPASRISMWMKNTILSLDMVFIRGNGEIESIAADTTPGSLKSVRSRGNVCCVLELNAGTARRLGLEPGQTVFHKVFGNQ